MSESPVKLTLEPGDILIKDNGSTAEVLSIEYDRDSKAKNPPVIGYQMKLTEPKTALVKTEHLPGFMNAWKHGKPPVASPSAAQPAAPDDIMTLIADLREQNEQLRDRNTRLEARNTELVESRDSAINHDATAADRVVELDDTFEGDIDEKTENLRLSYYDARTAARERDEHFPEYKLWLEQSLLKQRDFSTEQFNRLTEQLAEARLAASPIQTAPAVDTTAAPCREFEVIRGETPNGLDQREKNGWQIHYMQFANSSDGGIGQLGVVYYRIITTPVAPKPVAKVTVQPLGPTVTIIPEAVKSPRRFNADEYMAEVLEAANQAALDVALDMPVLSPRPLQLTGTAPMPKVSHE